MSASLVGSEMCIRDSNMPQLNPSSAGAQAARPSSQCGLMNSRQRSITVSYTHLTLPTICSV
eukprot:10866478-Alexandrium_andersonii.AAC.1